MTEVKSKSDIFGIREDLRVILESSGFISAGFLDLKSINLDQDIQALENWIAAGAHAEMHFMTNNHEARRYGNFILSEAKTAITLLIPYATGSRVRAGKGLCKNEIKKTSSKKMGSGSIKMDSLGNKNLISRYARGVDYHKIIQKKMSSALDLFKEKTALSFTYRIVVDTIPFFDRAHARIAGLGFVGKNTMLIRPGLGSYFFISTALLSLSKEEIASGNSKLSNPIFNLDCGSCTRCLDACPTGALPQPYFLDANKCLSYLSIEHRDVIGIEYIPYFKSSLYGCDLCQEACPYNISTLDLVNIPELRNMHEPFMQISAYDVATMDFKSYQKWFGGTAMTRAKYGGLVRNALYHLYATNHTNLKDVLLSRTHDENSLIKSTVKQLLQFYLE